MARPRRDVATLDTAATATKTRAGLPVLEVRNLSVTFRSRGAVAAVEAVRGIDLSLSAGEVLAVVGESGSGKSASARAMLGLIPPHEAQVAGSVTLGGEELIGMPPRQLRDRRGQEIAMVFQDPRRALNPTMRVGRQIVEVMRAHMDVERGDAREAAMGLLARVGIGSPEARMSSYPHELSGGMCQRVAIAMAIACSPKVLVADEPTTALDVSMQAEILRLLKGMCELNGLGVILITHDLGLASEYADRVAVMYAGSIVEEGGVKAVVDTPRMPYTAALVASARQLESGWRGPLTSMRGEPGGAGRGARGCAFAPRCERAQDRCREEAPALSGEGHRAACWFPVSYQ